VKGQLSDWRSRQAPDPDNKLKPIVPKTGELPERGEAVTTASTDFPPD
jgi:hypothetical protein